MCNLNILIKKENADIIPFLMATTSNSYSHNKDGDGFYSDGELVKGKKKINLFKYKENLNNSQIIINHQRISTSGHENAYTQPFQNDDFVLAHNGIINDFLGKRGSDTYGFFLKFNKIFKKQRGERDKRIIKTIKKVFKKMVGGSFSIALLDKQTDKLYYFKNYRTSISLFRNKDFVYLTTLSDNEVFLDLLGKGFNKIDMEDDFIYCLFVENKVRCKRVGKIKYKEENWNNNNWKSKWAHNKKEKTINEKVEPIFWENSSNKLRERNIQLFHYFENCVVCGLPTRNFDISNSERICDDCILHEEIEGIDNDKNMYVDNLDYGKEYLNYIG